MSTSYDELDWETKLERILKAARLAYQDYLDGHPYVLAGRYWPDLVEDPKLGPGSAPKRRESASD